MIRFARAIMMTSMGLGLAGCGTAMVQSERPDVIRTGETTYGGALGLSHQFTGVGNNFPRGTRLRTTLPAPAFVVRRGLNDRIEADGGIGLTGFSASVAARVRYQWWGAQDDHGFNATVSLGGAFEGGGIEGVDEYDPESALRVSKYNFRQGGGRLSQAFGGRWGDFQVYAGPQLTWVGAASHYTMSDQTSRRFTYSGVNPGGFVGLARQVPLSWTTRPMIVDFVFSISKLPPNLRGGQEELFPAIALTLELLPPTAPSTVPAEAAEEKPEDMPPAPTF